MNKIDKTKSPISFEQEKEKKAKDIFDEFKEFSAGYRVLFLIHRGKEGGNANNTKFRKIITRNSEEWFEALKELIDIQMSSEIPYRVYASVNERNFDKAIRQFKYEQLEADYYDQIQKENFYLDIKNRFIGCLMQPAQRKTSLFMFDVDNQEGRDVQGEALALLPNELIIKTYATKNGWHIITLPFDYTKLSITGICEFKKDGLLLLSY